VQALLSAAVTLWQNTNFSIILFANKTLFMANLYFYYSSMNAGKSTSRERQLARRASSNEVATAQPERQERPLRLRVQLAPTGAGPSREIATDLGARLVCAAEELP
jgi:hypothetical protein